jgi:pyruvate,water dikinase
VRATDADEGANALSRFSIVGGNTGNAFRMDASTGEILVAPRTDPGWVALYPAISGLLVERGSVLSHSAIVAREMGLPTIVGVQGLCARLGAGQRVKMDGGTGRIELLPQEEASP